jgi:3(or 17)beta-hydroxysteroid dehydrogenase
MSRLGGKNALVTGGASGLGRAIAQRLAAEGARVLITDVRTDVGSAVAQGDGFEFLAQDVCSEPQWLHVIEEAERRLGPLSVLVNNAGILGPTEAVSPEDSSLESWRKVFATNVEGVFLGCRAAISTMRRRGEGSIINISSVAGLLATPYATAYGASKAAVRQLTKSVAQYCAEEGLKIRCNSVHPGNVMTPLWEEHARRMAKVRQVSIDTIITEVRGIIPMGEFTQLHDVAAAVAFLASEDSRHITGSKLIVDGGIVGCDTYRSVSGKAALSQGKVSSKVKWTQSEH